MSLMLKIKSILGIAPEQKKEMVQTALPLAPLHYPLSFCKSGTKRRLNVRYYGTGNQTHICRAHYKQKGLVQRRFDNLMFNNNGNLDVVIPLMKEEFNKRPGRH